MPDAPADGTLVMVLTTLGGDPGIGRAMGDDVRLLREYTDREVLFLGKVAVYSAGATFMAAFPVAHRFLTRGARPMLHEWSMTRTIQLSGPPSTLPCVLRAKLNEIEQLVTIQDEGFRDLVRGSRVPFERSKERAPSNWYIAADEARELGLVLDVI